MTDHPQWMALCEASQAALSFNPEQVDARGLLEVMKSRRFYVSPAQGIYWEDEAPRFTNVVNDLI